MSSFKTSSFVVLELEVDGIFGKELAQLHGSPLLACRAPQRNDWLLPMQRAITLLRMQFPYRVASDVPLFLAPMAGVSESPFRLLCRRFGADVVVSGFISAVGVSRRIAA